MYITVDHPTQLPFVCYGLLVSYWSQLVPSVGESRVITLTTKVVSSMFETQQYSEDLGHKN